MICWWQWPHMAQQDSRIVLSYTAAATSLISRAKLSIKEIPSNFVVFHCRLTRPKNTPLTNAVSDNSSRENIFGYFGRETLWQSVKGCFLEFWHSNISSFLANAAWRPFCNITHNFETVTLKSPSIVFGGMCPKVI